MTQRPPLSDIDPAWIAAVARQVVQRLRNADRGAGTSTTGSAPLTETLITLETLKGYADKAVIKTCEGAVVTPAARDEAKLRGIRLVKARHTVSADGGSGEPRPVAGGDANSPCVLKEQLDRRGIVLPRGLKLSWSEQPAAEVHRRCVRGERAAMVSALADVDRFEIELSPQSWVLDRNKLNLTAAVNVAARIAKLSKGAA